MKRSLVKSKGILRRLPASMLLIVIFIFPLITVEAQNNNRARRVTRLEGVTIRGNRTTLRPGYEYVRESENVVAVRKKKRRKKKKEKEITGRITCVCLGNGDCNLTMSAGPGGGESTNCTGSCDQCGTMVTIDPQ